MSVQLTLHTQPSVPLEAEVLTPDRLAGLSASEIAVLPVMHGNQAATLGDFFHVDVGAGLAPAPRVGHWQALPLRVTIQGDVSRIKRLGEQMTAGLLHVKGNVGMHVGSGMSGGEIIVDGHAGDWLGAEMRGGRIMVKGNAGHWVGAAYRGARKGMLGGEIIVHGNAGAEVGHYMRRGLIAIAGNCGDFAGADMLAGSIIVLGQMGQRAGAGMRRGTILAMQGTKLLPTFNFDCHYRPSFLRLYLQHLRSLGLPITDVQLNSHYQRWSGDMLELGRGEILLGE